MNCENLCCDNNGHCHDHHEMAGDWYGINVTALARHPEPLVVEEAAELVPEEMRKPGARITFWTFDGWQTWQFQPMDVREWVLPESWVQDTEELKDLQNQIDSIQIGGWAVSNQLGDDPHIGISQQALTELIGYDHVPNSIRGRIQTVEDEIGTDTTSDSLSGRITSLEGAVGTGGSVDSRIEAAKSEIKGNATTACDTLGKAEGLVSAEKTRAQVAEGALQQLYENLTQSDIIVVDDHTQVVIPLTNAIYREQGTDSFSDWMYYNDEWMKMAQYDTSLDGSYKFDVILSAGTTTKILERTILGGQKVFVYLYSSSPVVYNSNSDRVYLATSGNTSVSLGAPTLNGSYAGLPICLNVVNESADVRFVCNGSSNDGLRLYGKIHIDAQEMPLYNPGTDNIVNYTGHAMSLPNPNHNTHYHYINCITNKVTMNDGFEGRIRTYIEDGHYDLVKSNPTNNNARTMFAQDRRRVVFYEDGGDSHTVLDIQNGHFLTTNSLKNYNPTKNIEGDNLIIRKKFYSNDNLTSGESQTLLSRLYIKFGSVYQAYVKIDTQVNYDVLRIGLGYNGYFYKINGEQNITPEELYNGVMLYKRSLDNTGDDGRVYVYLSGAENIVGATLTMTLRDITESVNSQNAKAGISYQGEEIKLPTRNSRHLGSIKFSGSTIAGRASSKAGQGVAVYDNYLFRFYIGGLVNIYDISIIDSPVFLQSLQLDIPSTHHCNTAQFEDEVYGNTGFPLLHLCGASYYSDGLVFSVGLSGGIFSMTLVKEIHQSITKEALAEFGYTLPDDAYMYYGTCAGSGKSLIFGMSQSNGIFLLTANVVASQQEGSYEVEQYEVNAESVIGGIKDFTIPYRDFTSQGFKFYENKFYYCTSTNAQIRIYDMSELDAFGQKNPSAIIPLSNPFIKQSELEDIDIYTEKILGTFNGQNGVFLLEV